MLTSMLDSGEQQPVESTININMQIQPPAVQLPQVYTRQARVSSGYLAQSIARPAFWYLEGTLAPPPRPLRRPSFSYRSHSAQQHLLPPPSAPVNSIHTYDFTEEEANLTLEETIQPVEQAYEEPAEILDAASIIRELELGFNLQENDDDPDSDFNPFAVELSANAADFQSELFELGQRAMGDVLLEAVNQPSDGLLNNPVGVDLFDFGDQPGPSGPRAHAVQHVARDGPEQSSYSTNVPEENNADCPVPSANRPEEQPKLELQEPGAAKDNDASSDCGKGGRLITIDQAMCSAAFFFNSLQAAKSNNPQPKKPEPKKPQPKKPVAAYPGTPAQHEPATLTRHNEPRSSMPARNDENVADDNEQRTRTKPNQVRGSAKNSSKQNTLTSDSRNVDNDDNDNAQSTQPEEREQDSSSEDNIPIANLVRRLEQRSHPRKRKAPPAARPKKAKKNIKQSVHAMQTRSSKPGMVLRSRK